MGFRDLARHEGAGLGDTVADEHRSVDFRCLARRAALQEQLAPPTLRLQHPAEDCTLDYIPHTPRPMRMTNVLSNTFGFGGSNVSILFRRAS